MIPPEVKASTFASCIRMHTRTHHTSGEGSFLGQTTSGGGFRFILTKSNWK